MYCPNCGEQIDDKAVVCPKCGVPVNGKRTDPEDAPSIGFAILSFFIPIVGLILFIVGLILFLVWRNSCPLRARSAGKGALIGAIVNFVIGFISICSTIGAAGAGRSLIAFLS